MKNSHKRVLIIITVILLLTNIPCLYADTAPSRIYGADRIETALKVCDQGWADGAVNIILAPADQANLVDALAASSLAGQKNAPILLTYKNKLDIRVKTKISTLRASMVYIVGAISDEISEEIDKMNDVTVVRLKGANRLETTKKINDLLTNPAGTFIVGYNSLADALTVSSYAAANRYAIILADSKGNIPTGQKVLGSSAVIVGNSDQVRDITGAYRISGINIFQRNKNMIERFPYQYDKVYIANGYDNHLVDALIIASLAAKYNAPVLLTNNSNIEAGGIVNASLKSTSEIIALGGASVVTDAVRDTLRYVAPDMRVENVKSLNLNSIEIRFSEKVDQVTATDVRNYKINGYDLTQGTYAASLPLLQEDMQSLMLLLYKPAEQGERLNIEINNVKNMQKSKTILAYRNDISLVDNTRPKIDSVKVRSEQELAVKFSELVKMPDLKKCEEWQLDYVRLKDRKLESVKGLNEHNCYSDTVILKFEGSIRNALGYGTHRLVVTQGSAGGQLSDAAGFTFVEENADGYFEFLI